jgi:putative ABC transport system permease protein
VLGIVRYAPVLPAVLDAGVIVDVRYLLSELPGFLTEANWQVWLSADAPPDAAARLAAAGMHVNNVHTERARLTQLGRQGPALALLLLVVCAIVGTVLAVGGTAISISAGSRRRSYEIAALRAVGVTRRSLFGASATEQSLLLGAGAVLGVPAGWVAARLAMPVIPEFADRTPIALRYVPAVIPTVLFAAAFVVLLTVTSLLAARALIRAAAPSRLREAEG